MWSGVLLLCQVVPWYNVVRGVALSWVVPLYHVTRGGVLSRVIPCGQGCCISWCCVGSYHVVRGIALSRVVPLWSSPPQGRGLRRRTSSMSGAWWSPTASTGCRTTGWCPRTRPGPPYPAWPCWAPPRSDRPPVPRGPLLSGGPCSLGPPGGLGSLYNIRFGC